MTYEKKIVSGSNLLLKTGSGSNILEKTVQNPTFEKKKNLDPDPTYLKKPDLDPTFGSIPRKKTRIRIKPYFCIKKTHFLLTLRSK